MRFMYRCASIHPGLAEEVGEPPSAMDDETSARRFHDPGRSLGSKRSSGGVAALAEAQHQRRYYSGTGCSLCAMFQLMSLSIRAISPTVIALDPGIIACLPFGKGGSRMTFLPPLANRSGINYAPTDQAQRQTRASATTWQAHPFRCSLRDRPTTPWSLDEGGERQPDGPHASFAGIGMADLEAERRALRQIKEAAQNGDWAQPRMLERRYPEKGR